MRIIKEKSIDITVEAALDAIRTGKAPKGMAMNVSEESVIFEPLDNCNIFGEVNDDYETIYFEDK